MSEQDKKPAFPKPPSFDYPTDSKSDGVGIADEKTPQETMDELDGTLRELESNMRPTEQESESLGPYHVLQEQVRQKIEGAIIENAVPIEDRMVVKIRDTLGKLRLLLLSQEGSDFDEFGRDETDEPLDEEKINSTFTWFENNSPDVNKFLELSGYVKKAVDNSQEGAPVS